MKILVCCSAAKEEGAGHVMRSVALAEQALAAGWDVSFCGRIEHPMARAAVAALGVDTIASELTSAAIVNAAKASGAGLVHVDSYLSLGDLRDRAEQAGLVLSSMEDGPYGRRTAHLVIDPSPGAEEQYRRPDGSLRVLLGLRAAPIRAALRDSERRWQGSSDRDPLRVLVVMGGTDAMGMTKRAVDAWTSTGIRSECHVITQTDDEHFAGSSRDCTIVRHAPGPEVPLLFHTMDFVISGAGTTIWELAALRVPAALIQLVPNQLAGYQYAVGNGIAVGLGSTDAWDDAVARTRLKELGHNPTLRRQLSLAAERAIDGDGARRIASLWGEIASQHTGVTARRAVQDDASQLFEWRNDPDVRAASRTTGSFSWSSHISWFRDTLDNPGRVMTIVENAGRPAAAVRFDRLPEREGGWEVSITVSPAFRGTGMAGRALRAAEGLLLQEHPEAAITFVAEMLLTNQPSRRLFAAAGYSPPAMPQPDAPAAGEDATWGRLEKTCPPLT